MFLLCNNVYVVVIVFIAVAIFSISNHCGLNWTLVSADRYIIRVLKFSACKFINFEIRFFLLLD